MKRLTTDNPKDNIEAALNLFYIKGHETWVRGGGTGPEYADVRLFDYTRQLIKAHIPDVDLGMDDVRQSALEMVPQLRRKDGFGGLTDA